MISETQRKHREELKKITRQTRNAKYYENIKANMKTCNVCGCDVIPTYWNKHIETKIHKTWGAILEARGMEKYY